MVDLPSLKRIAMVEGACNEVFDGDEEDYEEEEEEEEEMEEEEEEEEEMEEMEEKKELEEEMKRKIIMLGLNALKGEDV